MDFGVWVSIFATLVAVASAAISRHNSRLSVRPVMGFWVQSDKGTHRLILANKGNGPAVIESATFEPVSFYFGHEAVVREVDADAFLRHSLMDIHPHHYFEIEHASPLRGGHMLGSGDECDVFRFRATSDQNLFDLWKKEKWETSFNVTVELKDMFDERWQVTFKDGKSSFGKKVDF